MRWTKLKSEIENGFCDSLRKRITINSARYGACTCGHAWITLDKEIIANFCTMAFWNTNPKYDEEKRSWIKGELRNPDNKKFDKLLVDYGELSRQDVYKACWEFIHDLSINDAMESDDVLIQTLAIIDKRVRKNRFKKIDKEKLHRLSRKFYDLRYELDFK